MKLPALCSLVMILLSLPVFAQAPKVSQGRASILEKELEEAFNQAIAAAEKLDYQRLAEDVEDGRQAGFIVAGAYYHSFEELLEIVRSTAQGVTSQKINLKEKKITVLTDHLGLITASGTADVTLTSGEKFSRPFFWSFLYEKTGGEWKVIHSHQSGPR